MNSHLTTAAIILFATSYVLSEEHLVPKHGLKKRDLSEADMEMILKALMLKLEHKEPDMADKVHYAKESEMKYAERSHPVEYEYAKEAFPHESFGYEMKKDVGIEEKEMKAFSMKLKELGIGKDLEESYGKEAYLETPGDKYMSEKEHMLKDPVLKEQSGKVFEDALKDKFNDKEMSLAESLYHMKIAGDVETYPHLKMEPLHEMKMADEKLHLETTGAEETYLKKVDELGKTLLKEDHLKEGDFEAYLKKVAEEEKSHLYAPEIAHAESHFKSDEEKSLEAWKASHKDVFIADEKLVDEKLKKEASHHKEEGISIGMNDELIKKIKSFDEDLAKEHDELIHTLGGKVYKDELIAEGTTAYEKAKEQAHKDAHIHLTDEAMKKHIEEALAYGAKEKGASTDMLFGKGFTDEKIHGIDAKFGAGIEKSLHGIAEEEVFKSKEAHALDKAYGFDVEKAKFGSKIPLMENEFKHAVSHGAGEAEKTFKIHDEELLKKEKASGTDAFLHKSLEDELMKKGETFGKDAFFHKAHEEDFLKEKGYVGEDFLHKAHEEELLKKEKAFDADAFLHKAQEDELLKKGKAFDVDSFLHKAHEEELLKKEKAFDGGVFQHKAHGDELLKDKAFDVDASLHKAHEDELIKKEIAYGTDALFHKDKDVAAASEDHHVLHEKSHKSIQELKAKFFELLRRVLHSRKCHLVTMRPGELLGIVNCVSRSKLFFLIFSRKFNLYLITLKVFPANILVYLQSKFYFKKCTRF